VSKDELSEDRNLAQSKRAKARLILTFSASKNRESVAYRSFRRAGESCHAGGVRKITTGIPKKEILPKRKPFLSKRKSSKKGNSGAAEKMDAPSDEVTPSLQAKNATTKKATSSRSRIQSMSKEERKKVRREMLDSKETRTLLISMAQKKAEKKASSCWISMKVSNQKGYVQLCLDGMYFCVHVVAFWEKEGKGPAEGFHVSHLCHNPACFNPDHLISESSKDNNSRKGCLVWIPCPHCKNSVIGICPHQPSCIKDIPPEFGICSVLPKPEK